MAVARRVHALQNRGARPSTLLALQYALAQRLVFRKLKTALGLGRAECPARTIGVRLGRAQYPTCPLHVFERVGAPHGAPPA